MEARLLWPPVTWASSLFFSDRFLSGMSRRREDKEDRKAEAERSPTNCLTPSTFVKSCSILFTVCRDKQGDS